MSSATDDRGTEPDAGYSSETKMFAVIAVLTGVMCAIDTVTVEDASGKVMLGLTACPLAR
ncbi:MAG: hypothetical protein U5R31_11400 [Acidimicrobiia bacterium]|nr:hypothetical protein [Acidimicrobiia bacterium]